MAGRPPPIPQEEITIGVLALQGAFAQHRAMLERLHVPSLEVRTAQDLAQVDGLIIPGGESTTMRRLNTLPLAEWGRPLFGTCAGLILMEQLGLLDISVERNAYGRQVHSFATELTVYLETPHRVEALFIRAPRITALHTPDVQLLADEPVLIRQGFHLASTFHPELTTDPTIHHYFLNICLAARKS